MCFAFLMAIVCRPFICNVKTFSLQEIESRKIEAVGLRRHYVQTNIIVEGENIEINIQTFVPNIIKKKKANVVMIHGTATTCLYAFGDVLFELTKYFNVYLLDLPGFGRSTASRPMHLSDKNKIITFYVECINAVRFQIGINRSLYIAHSYGGFLATHFAHRYGEFVTHLYLLDAVGILPILGPLGAFWGVCFKLSVPNFLRFYGYIGRFTAITLTKAFASENIYYIFDILSSQNTWGDKTLAKFINLTFSTCNWNTPAVLELSQVISPVCLVYGDNDSIIPAWQGKELSKILNVQLYIVVNCAHSPLNESNASVLLEFINSNIIKSIPIPLTIKKHFLKDYMIKFRSFFYLKETIKCLNSFYEEFASLCVNSKISNIPNDCKNCNKIKNKIYFGN